MTVLIAGIDLGTSSVKGAVYTSDGLPIRRAVAEVDVTRPHLGLMEQDSGELVGAAAGILDQLWPFDALAIVGQINTHILVDESGSALTPAMVWGDRRAASVVRGVNASSLLARVVWWETNQPEVWERARWIMLPRDYLLYQLTGQVVTDPTSWPDLISTNSWRAGLPRELRRRLPRLAQPHEVVGDYRSASVVAGCMDSVAAVIGCGRNEVGTAIDVGGTSETVGLICSTGSHTDAVRAAIPLPSGYWHAGPTHGGMRVFEWLRRLVDDSLNTDRALELVVQAETEPTGIVFLPYLEGERAPIWQPNARGAFLGLGAEHDRRHLVKAVLEGVAFSVRHILDSVRPGCDCDPATLYVSGAPARIPIWNQIKADVLGIPVIVPRESEVGALGGAMLGAAGVMNESVSEAQERMAGDAIRVSPNPGATDCYRTLYSRYVAAARLVQDWGFQPIAHGEVQ